MTTPEPTAPGDPTPQPRRRHEGRRCTVRLASQDGPHPVRALAAALARYQLATRPALAQYEAAIGAAWEQYGAAERRAWARFKAAKRAAREQYDAATGPARAEYEAELAALGLTPAERAAVRPAEDER
jgi:hypothetical protein